MKKSFLLKVKRQLIEHRSTTTMQGEIFGTWQPARAGNLPNLIIIRKVKKSRLLELGCLGNSITNALPETFKRNQSSFSGTCCCKSDVQFSWKKCPCSFFSKRASRAWQYRTFTHAPGKIFEGHLSQNIVK